jgi:ABC-2 type transport system permease protein
MTPATAPTNGGATLVPIVPTGWRGGLGNLVRKELGQWWGTRLWWIQLLVWMVILNGVTTVIMLDSGVDVTARFDEALQTFLLVGATAIGIGVVLTVQGAVVGEKELGTAAWVVSKPVSRASFVLAKLIAYTVGFVVTALVVPAVVFVIESAVLLSLPVSYGSFALGLGVLALAVFFYIALTLALGTLFASRGPVAGIGIALLLIGLFFNGMLPQPVVLVMPWLLGDIASAVALGSTLPSSWLVPVIATAVASVALVLVAVRRFAREEF